MAIINLRDYYPFYTSDCFMEVSDEVAEMFKEFDRSVWLDYIQSGVFCHILRFSVCRTAAG